MTFSMTGFARRDADLGTGVLSCEIRTVNHRYLELSMRVPEVLRDHETRLRERVSGEIKRGKVDCTFRFESAPGQIVLSLNQGLAQALVGAGRTLETELGLGPLMAGDVLRWPNMLSSEVAAAPPDLADQALQLLTQALADLMSQRAREGAKIDGFLHARLDDMLFQVATGRALAPALVPEYRERLHQRLREIAMEVDAGRLEQEVVLFAQRADISEELDRLAAHLAEVDRLIASPGPVGRKLDFMMQELNREANTLGAKSSDLRLTAVAMDLKVSIEQMREQIQNVE